MVIRPHGIALGRYLCKYMRSSGNVDTNEEFRGEYEVALESWLRRRFSFFCASFFTLECGIAIFTITLAIFDPKIPDLALGEQNSGPFRIGVYAVAPLITVSILGWFLWVVRPRLERRSELVRAASFLILLVGFVDLALMVLLQDDPTGTEGSLGWLFVMHFASTLFLPWTPRESVKAIVPVFGAWIALELLFGLGDDPIGTVVKVILAPLVLLPGMLVAHVRMRRWSRRFRSEAFKQSFLSLRREMSQTKIMHESLFPDQIEDEAISFDFVFKPMRDLGGDFIHASRGPDGTLRVLLLDVTGHGLAAAMTVTRLSGEIERIFAEQPRIGPAEVLQHLNHYVFLLLSQHSIFATAVIVEVDPRSGSLRYANAGHPPAFLKAYEESPQRLDPTAMMLGAISADEFECEEHQETMAPGDLLILYTDGSIESRDRHGQLLGIDGFERVIKKADAPKRWASYLMRITETHQAGKNEDDILIATIAMKKPPSIDPIVETPP